MFSFWSNDDEENSDCNDENNNEKGKSAKPEKFLYVGNEKKDDYVRDKSPNPLTSNAVIIQNNRNTNDFNERKRRMDDMLNNVWSVRKDVRVNVANAAKDAQIGTKSFYSRHGEISGAGLHADSCHEKNASTGTGVPTKTWSVAKTRSVAKTNYSYSDSTQCNQCDILESNVVTDDVPQIVPSDDHGDDVQQQNIVNSLKYGTVTAPNSTNREPSARTRRAQKFNNAYLRSTGLGKYTPGMSKPSELHHNNNKWKR